MTLATTLWKWCLKQGISIQSTHIQGVSNQIADFKSRQPYQKNNWMIQWSIFYQMQQLWGLNDVDLFADQNTTQLKKYVSWLPDPGSYATDAFTLSWKQFIYPYLNLPWNLINRCL
ncbi:hypothetical protein CLU79DRAFT_762254 [Phycomyces nitens]|nr:hypothetical protein CLU79DRAFT_762254 [Phycomyces nitens]